MTTEKRRRRPEWPQRAGCCWPPWRASRCDASVRRRQLGITELQRCHRKQQRATPSDLAGISTTRSPCAWHCAPMAYPFTPTPRLFWSCRSRQLGVSRPCIESARTPATAVPAAGRAAQGDHGPAAAKCGDSCGTSQVHCANTACPAFTDTTPRCTIGRMWGSGAESS